MDINSLVAQAKTFLPVEEYNAFRNTVNEIYLQSELRALYNGMPLDKEPEPWRADRIAIINKQLASIPV